MTQGARYPGAQPFADDALSRLVFFGRPTETKALADLILAIRLVVVFAKSGVGKTSLLQAGVAQMLRDEGYLPLFVRVNDTERDLLASLFDGVADAAKRQHIEYHLGRDTSLWHFFKTTEFWRGDRLLTPVLILDQFEELFTLHHPERRGPFLRDLGHLVRGVRPIVAVSDEDARLGEGPPAIRIVLSLREDYLGSLEECADSIPQILDHRFRLAALTTDAAAEALEGPARVENDQLKTRPFRFRPGTVEAILTHLSRQTRVIKTSSKKYVEPFHLQLVCQRIESVARMRQSQLGGDVEIGLDDLGGTRGLDLTLRDFFKDVLKSIEPRRKRNKVRRLCQSYLISPEGRRLSLEREEINRILKISPETLAALVERRLLRADQRTDSWYFELSHDSLIMPILASRKPQALAIGALALVASSFLALGALGVLILSPIFLALPFTTTIPDNSLGFAVFMALFLMSIGALMMWIGVAGVRRSVETLNRYTTAVR